MAPITLTVTDETTAGDTLVALELQLAEETVTVRELIRARVHQEVRGHNAKSAAGRERFFGLVQPDDAERELNGYRLRRPRPLDPERQTDVALRAFERGHVLLVVGDRQVESLDDEVTLTPATSVSFLKLVPLVGG
jgi:hypothetical protein